MTEATRTPATHEPGPGRASQYREFAQFCEARADKRFADVHEFYEWSIDHYESFWSLFLEWSGIVHQGDRYPVCTDDLCEWAEFFPNLLLSYPENLLRTDPSDLDRPALTACHAYGPPDKLTRRELIGRVRSFAEALEKIGVRAGDHVAAIVHNNAGAVIGALATAAVGATFASAAPDMGADAVLSRFCQLAPKVLLTNLHDAGNPAVVGLPQRVSEVCGQLSSLERVVLMDDHTAVPELDVPADRFSQLSTIPPSENPPWARFPFNHPLFTLFSSGTTGTPKAIVHGAGGTLLEHLKEHRLHGDLRPSDKLFFHTSAAWMMWNWQLSALATLAEIVLYDGPVEGPQSLWQIVSAEAVTVFGTSPSYLLLCEDANYSPRANMDLKALRSVLSTGSILYDSQYHWVRDNVGALPVQSISGGTDILGCFVLGHPDLPVYAGECQTRSFALAVVAQPPDGTGDGSVIGELVCRKPFPSRPLYFVGDPQRRRFHNAYFRQNPGVWTHGDRIEITPRHTIRVHGRSDGVLDVDGVRIGPAEIYTVLRRLPQIREAVVVEQQHPNRSARSRMVLVVVMRTPGTLDQELRRVIRRELARRASPAHVPRLIVEVADLPRTHSGKTSERAVRETLDGAAQVDVTGLRNPQSLAEIRASVLAETRAARQESDIDSVPPRSLADLHGFVRALWEEILDLAPVHDDDSFFDLGGTSLLAVRLFEEMHARRGIDLPLSVLLEAPTLSDLVDFASGAEDGTGSRLLLLKAGTGAPLFLIPGLGGDALQLRTLGASLPVQRPVYSVIPKQLQAGERGDDRIEDIALDYLAQIRRAQPSGPLSLVGQSFGGLIAFEMAQVLSRAAERVDLLCLLDTDVHHKCLPAAERRRFWRQRITLRGLGLRRYGVVGALTGGSRPSVRRQWRLHWSAFSKYRPKEYDGTVIYLRCSIRQRGYGDPAPVWAGVARGGLVTHTVPGRHSDLVRPPAVNEVAALLATLTADSQPVTPGGPTVGHWSREDGL